MNKIRNIVIIGAGNVGSRLARSFTDADCKIAQVAGRRESAVNKLADELGTSSTLDLGNIVKQQDMYLLALPDKAIGEVLPKLGLTDELLVHTSGSVPLEILSPFSENIGVFYPLQTFTSERAIELADVPILIEANRISNEDALLELAGRISKNTSVADSQRRERIHIAAVFAGNFSNHMYALAKKLLEDNGYDYELLVPLIRETAQKAIEFDPMSAQTGPARREDQEIIDRHLQLLNNEPAIKELYEKISASIRDQYRSK